MEGIDFFLFVHKNREHWLIKPNSEVGKTGYKWQTTDTSNQRLVKPPLVKDSCIFISSVVLHIKVKR